MCAKSCIKKIKSIFLAFYIWLLFVFVHSAYADGMFYKRYSDNIMWELQNVGQQLCAINYESGLEKMLLYVDLKDLQGEKAVWIFPVPAKHIK